MPFQKFVTADRKATLSDVCEWHKLLTGRRWAEMAVTRQRSDWDAATLARYVHSRTCGPWPVYVCVMLFETGNQWRSRKPEKCGQIVMCKKRDERPHTELTGVVSTGHWKRQIIDNMLVEIIRSLYDEATSEMQLYKTEIFSRVAVGVRLGCPLFPILIYSWKT